MFVASTTFVFSVLETFPANVNFVCCLEYLFAKVLSLEFLETFSANVNWGVAVTQVPPHCSCGCSRPSPIIATQPAMQLNCTALYCNVKYFQTCSALSYNRVYFCTVICNLTFQELHCYSIKVQCTILHT